MLIWSLIYLTNLTEVIMEASNKKCVIKELNWTEAVLLHQLGAASSNSYLPWEGGCYLQSLYILEQ